MSAQEIQVPDIGDFSDVPVIEIHVAAGDTVAAEDPLVTLESDKATLDVPAPVAGTVTELRVAVGDTVSEGTVIMVIDAAGRRRGGPRDRHAGSGGQRSPRRRLGRSPGRPRDSAAPRPRAQHGAPRVPARRPARRGARARRRPRRLHRRVPGRRPRQAGRHGRQPRPAGRGLPERRLHPVQGAAARGQGDRRDQGDGRATGCRFARPDHRPGRAARLEGQAWSPGSPAGWPGWPSSARSRTVVGTGRFTSPNMVEVTADGRLDQHGQLRAGHHRRRLGAGHPAVRAARRPAGDRLHRRAGAGRHPGAAAGARRRDHRAGDGHASTTSSGSKVSRGRAAGPAHPRRGRGHRQAAHPADHQALRGHLGQDQGHRRGGRPGRADRHLRGRQGPRVGGVRQGPGRGRAQAQRQG